MTERDGEATRLDDLPRDPMADKRYRLAGKVGELRSYHENIDTMPPLAEHILRALQREIIILTAEIVLGQADLP